MNELIVHKTNLPDTLEDLSRFVLIGREKLNSVKAEVRVINKLELVQEVIEQKRAEAQMIAEVVLDAEVRLGELFNEIPKNQGKRNDIVRSNTGVTTSEKTKEEMLNDLGFTKMQASRLERLADNQNLVEYVKAEARENGDIPTRARVLELAAYQKKQENESEENDDNIIETKIINMSEYDAKKEAELEEYYDFLDFRVSIYKELAKIVDLINRFEITDERMDALRDNFDAVLTVENEIRHINNSIEKLNLIKIEIQKGKKHGKK